MQNAISMENNSGFHGYSIDTIYPGWGNQGAHVTSTNPEPAEQKETSSMEQTDLTPVLSKNKSMPIWGIVVGILALVLLFGVGGK